MRDFRQALQWYRDKRSTARIGFNPDNMCLKVCRTARDIPAVYPTAKEAQDHTPQRHRVHRVRDLRRGMVLYFDDPNDSNRAGHIVTMIGRVPGFDPDKLSDILVETNSVRSGQITTVRGDYFQRYWGDAFQFGATWLNGRELDVPGRASKVKQFHKNGEPWDVKILDEAGKARDGVRAIVRAIDRQVDALPNSPKLKRVQAFVREYEERRVLKMDLLDAAVEDGRTGVVKRCRDEIRRLLRALPEK